MPSHPQRRPRRLPSRTRWPGRAPSGRSPAWRLLAPAVFVAAGALFVTSEVSSGGTDLRAGRYDDLAGLANAQAHDLSGLRTRTSALTRQVDRLTADLASSTDAAEQRKVEKLRGPAGLE